MTVAMRVGRWHSRPVDWGQPRGPSCASPGTANYWQSRNCNVWVPMIYGEEQRECQGHRTTSLAPSHRQPSPIIVDGISSRETIYEESTVRAGRLSGRRGPWVRRGEGATTIKKRASSAQGISTRIGESTAPDQGEGARRRNRTDGDFVLRHGPRPHRRGRGPCPQMSRSSGAPDGLPVRRPAGANGRDRISRRGHPSRPTSCSRGRSARKWRDAPDRRPEQ